MRGPVWWRGLAPRRRLLLGGVAAALVAAGVVSTVLSLGGPHLPESGRPAQDQLGPVLLVPGYGGGQGGLDVLAGKLRSAGRDAQVLTLPGDGTGDLLAQVGVLSSAVSAAYAHGAPSVDVIGYSAGGVVVRLWVARSGGDHQARRVVTLGSPLHGAQIAAVGSAVVPGACPVACQELAPGSALLQSVENRPLPGDLPWLSVWTEDDQTVTPADSARLDGAVNVPLQQVCADSRAQHGDLPTDAAVTGLVLRALSTAPLTSPTAADCGPLRTAGTVS
jgi:triacylglycerol lipase